MAAKATICSVLVGIVAFGSLAASAAPADATSHWAFQPCRKPPLPPAKSLWPRNEIDQFILATLDQKGLAPSAPADRITLIRRLYFTLTGLPPGPDEVEAFTSDGDPLAYEHLVDRLLASPHYGERWARHWLDVVHFGESHGYDKDKIRLHAWPYRDYVIRCFNQDKPYSRFVQEQLAGDVLFPQDPNGIVALGFIAAGPWDFVGHVELPISKTDGLIARYNDRDDMVMAAISTFQSLTVHCARCHDHKFDPISQRDYYRLQAVFAGVDRVNRPFDEDPVVHIERRKLTAELSRGSVETSNALAALPKPQLVYAAANDFKPEGSFTPAHGVRPVHLLARGDVKRPLEVVSAGALPCVPGVNADFTPTDNEGARRAALANWITDRGNMLTRRSIVNRVWQYHFGRGLVDTPNDFGRMGSLPTHPELLDWLAFWFLEHGESFKALHRFILTSATFRQSSAPYADHAKIDPENRFLWRMNRHRLDAEEIRDAMLAVSGSLDPKMGGPSIQQFYFKDDHSPVYDYTRFDVDSPGSFRRSIYRHIVRSVPDPFMDCLDAADPNLLTARRNSTLTALQALSTLNNPFVLRQSGRFAQRVTKRTHDPSGQIGLAWKLAFSRAPSADERTRLQTYTQHHGLTNTCRVILNSSEFLFVD
jgi:hypothetical protein